MSERRAAPLPRVLAPIALALAAVLFVGVIAGSIGAGGGGEARDAAEQREAREAGAPPAAGERQAEEPTARRATYTVKTGDTLGGISQKTGVSIERLQELNPDLDPQALVSGQKIKLR